MLRRVGISTLLIIFSADVYSSRFFHFYHPYCWIFLEPLDSVACYARSELLFWVICTTGSRPRPDHPMMRARKPDLILALYVASCFVVYCR